MTDVSEPSAAGMVERVARAIDEATEIALATHGKFNTREMARAAIAAMRRPGDAIIRAGMLHQQALGKIGISVSDTWSVWEAQIDAALAEDTAP